MRKTLEGAGSSLTYVHSCISLVGSTYAVVVTIARTIETPAVDADYSVSLVTQDQHLAGVRTRTRLAPSYCLRGRSSIHPAEFSSAEPR